MDNEKTLEVVETEEKKGFMTNLKEKATNVGKTAWGKTKKALPYVGSFIAGAVGMKIYDTLTSEPYDSYDIGYDDPEDGHELAGSEESADSTVA